MDCGNKTATAGGLYPRLLREVGDINLHNCDRKLDPKYPLFFLQLRAVGYLNLL
jgi:hypothetical protein